SLLTSDPRAGVRPAGRDPGAFPLGFSGADREAPEVRHLRDYSNYVVPRRGMLSLGVWRLVAAYLGALILNLIAPLSGLGFLFVAGTLILSWLATAQWAWGWSYLRWLAAGLGVITAAWLVAPYLAAWTKRARDGLMAGAAVAVAVAMALGFLIAAPWAYYELVGLVLGSQPVALGQLEGGLRVFGFCKGPAPGEGRALDSLMTVLFPILAAAIPAAVIGYLKRSLWIFGFAAAGLLAAVEIVHVGEWLSREDYPTLVEWYPRLFVIAVVSGFVIN